MGRLGLSVLVVTAGFLYLPLVVLAVFSFNDSALMAFPLSGFTLEWYRELADNENFLQGFITSFLIAQPVGLLAMLFGLMASLALTAPGFRWRGLFAVLLLMPFLVPKSVLSIAQAMIMSRVGFDRGATALILAQSLVALPFATALISAVMVRFDP
ncbi:MAG: ydcV 2, partial [Proteobacteria bacterium]|nr:ydcV 2 [Pseudomonadota bacterium]